MTLKVEMGGFTLNLKGNATHKTEIENSVTGNITRINNTLDSLPQRLDNLKVLLSKYENELKFAQEETTKPFEKEAEYQEKSARLVQLNKDLDNTDTKKESVTDKLTEIKQSEKNVTSQTKKSADLAI